MSRFISTGHEDTDKLCTLMPVSKAFTFMEGNRVAKNLEFNDNNNNEFLIYAAQFDTNGILTALHIVLKYTQTHYMHLCMDIHEHSFSYT